MEEEKKKQKKKKNNNNNNDNNSNNNNNNSKKKTNENWKANEDDGTRKISRFATHYYRFKRDSVSSIADSAAHMRCTANSIRLQLLGFSPAPIITPQADHPSTLQTKSTIENRNKETNKQASKQTHQANK